MLHRRDADGRTPAFRRILTILMTMVLLATMLPLGFGAANAQSGGTLLASDGFGGSAGTLSNIGGGSGWGANWEVQNNDTSVPGYNVQTGSLSYSTLTTSGGKAVGGDSYQTAGRAFNTSASGPFASYLTNGSIGASGKTLWLSALLRKETANDEEVSLVLHNSASAWCTNCTGALVSVGYFGSSSNNNGTRYWSLKIGSTVYRSSTAVSAGQAVFLVVKLDFASTSTASLYVNPALSSAPSTASASGTSTSSLAFKSLAFYGGNGTGQGAVDEIRVGDSYAAVAPGGSTATATPVPPTATPGSGGSGTGLQGEYFNNTSLTAPSALTRTDSQVNFDWGTGSPGSGINTDNFSVRWTGQVEAPVSGSYTFYTVSDDGVRLWVNNQQLVNNWTNHAPTTNSGTISLTAGQKYSITMEYYEATSGAVARLQWSYSGQNQIAIPQSRLYLPSAPSGYAVTKIRFYPRSGENARMLNGRFSGSNTSPTNDFVTLATISTTPTNNAWTEITLTNSTIYRYLKYEAPNGSYGNVAEIEFYNGNTKLTGTGFGTAGSFNNSGNTYDKALDGNTSTYFDAASGDNQYVGIDLGASSQVSAPTFSPAPGNYTSTQTVTISSSTSGATIRYTTNGSAPTCSTGTQGTSVSVSSTTTIRAIACKSGLADSTVSAGTYTIGTAPTPVPNSISRVYHVGNSITDTINYSAMKSLVQSKGNTYDFGRHMIPGASLDWIWERGVDSNGDGVKGDYSGFQEQPYGYYDSALPNYRWDAITLQPFDRLLDSDVTYAKRYIDLARTRSENSNTQFYIYSRWPRKDSNGNLDFDQAWLRTYTGGYDNSNESRDYFQDLVVALRGQTGYLSKPVLMVPVGDVLYELNQRMKAGQIPGYTNITQIYADGIHLNNVGGLITGATFYATLYKTNPMGASYASYDVINGSADKDITDSLANAIYDAVWDVVSTHDYAGVK